MILLRTVFTIALIGLLGGCESPDSDFKGEFRIKLIDAPAAYQEVNIVFRRVLVHRQGASSELGWHVVSEDVQSHDLLQLRNGVSRNLVSAVLSTGDYDKIQILFGLSRVVENGNDITVKIPANLESGLIIQTPFTVKEDQVYGLTFDFDASRSILVTPQSEYILRPIIRVQAADLAGSIIGSVLPDSVEAVITTSTATDSVTTLSLAQSGNNSFELVDLPEGTYTVSIISGSPAFRDTTITGAAVVRKQKTNLGAIPLHPK
ncbi:MAG: hypothetical protein A2X67_01785 [Ignavibacteria bacterium GWA2_55_11]|nr:MAG: hypothetical protein A2X67_01785 [Ignavibacteria bacterium GWA2_55_11]OGU63122.1 MAG: hypothetical protein A3C56_10070 [Ignavibacteria bacterium RIFCSPHIGHO2_02_FULL_56_12]OGU71328.1 MAG: hypothetical protein A3G43_13660 [Ignavibacteria bacterium RIFCSPLOWO2_12_FULL_56_21]OGU75571.1 MAG: hypothetical protein A3H45_11340 [Ignavibacteria bacterium RIFCSPLOWO2_02_FULL_55_14]